MTRQYVAGELSVILGELQVATTSAAAAYEAARLRHEAETTPPAELAGVAERAIELTDGVCWDSLEHGEVAVFIREATIGAELWELGLCAGLLDDPARP